MGNRVANYSSKRTVSRLIRLFADRVSGPGSDPRFCLKKLIVSLRRQVDCTETSLLEKARAARRILRTEYRGAWDRDGILEPLGTSFSDGFKLSLNAKAPHTRMRFTEAHEICHTYLYEYVPEIKFYPHVDDPHEERLCNFGAAELLMPERSLRLRAKRSVESVDSLLELAAEYSVSPEAMISRLRALQLWAGELYIWNWERSGAFVLSRVVGSKSLPWRWSDERIPERAWANERCFGHTYLQCEIEPGLRQFKSISFDAKRHGSSLMVLCGARPQRRGNSKNSSLPLFC
jgi:Zn-dependent peptidase ImmA (M78 family)